MARTIVFIHGMFLNPKSWGHWRTYFSERGFECIAPAWPMHEGEPAELRRAPPAGLGELGLEEIVNAMRRVAGALEDPILVGHSVGGLAVQRLMAEGIGSLGVPICPVAPNRMLSFDWGFFRNSAAITNPLKGDAPFPMDAEAFHKNFGNTMARAASDAAFEAYAMPDSRNVLRDCMGDAGKVNVDRPHRPMLFISAEQDEIVPTELVERNSQAYTDRGSETEFVEFSKRGHFICGEPRWEEVAERVHTWIIARSTADYSGTVVRGGRTAAP